MKVAAPNKRPAGLVGFRRLSNRKLGGFGHKNRNSAAAVIVRDEQGNDVTPLPLLRVELGGLNQTTSGGVEMVGVPGVGGPRRIAITNENSGAAYGIQACTFVLLF